MQVQLIGCQARIQGRNFSGDFEPFSEDKWTYIKINDTIFRNARLCARCVMTTIDPETGQVDQLEEPLKTLKSFRSVEMLSFILKARQAGLKTGSDRFMQVSEKLGIFQSSEVPSLQEVTIQGMGARSSYGLNNEAKANATVVCRRQSPITLTLSL